MKYTEKEHHFSFRKQYVKEYHPKPEMNTPKSNCCGASVRLGADGQSTTQFYVCTECDKPCDTGGWKNASTPKTLNEDWDKQIQDILRRNKVKSFPREAFTEVRYLLTYSIKQAKIQLTKDQEEGKIPFFNSLIKSRTNATLTTLRTKIEGMKKDKHADIGEVVDCSWNEAQCYNQSIDDSLTLIIDEMMK